MSVSISEHQLLSYLPSSKTLLRTALEKEETGNDKFPGLAFNFSDLSCFWCFLRAAQICDCAVLFALCVAGIVTALTWPTSLLTVANVIDNPWGVCLHRSAEVGKHLAHILLSRQQVTG